MPEPVANDDRFARPLAETKALATIALARAALPPRIESRLTTRVLLANRTEKVYRTLKEAGIW